MEGQWMERYGCNLKPQCLDDHEHRTYAIDHTSGSHCLMPQHQTVIWIPWWKRAGTAWKEGTPITGRVINHNHTENKMRQRQSWTTGQKENCSMSVLQCWHAVESDAKAKRWTRSRLKVECWDLRWKREVKVDQGVALFSVSIQGGSARAWRLTATIHFHFLTFSSLFASWAR